LTDTDIFRKKNSMDAEFLQLAQRAVAALEAANSTSWVEIAQLAVSGVGLLAILVGLKRMGEAGARRDREIDELAGAFRKQGEAMTQAFTQQGQALERQGEAMTQALTQQGQALERQGEALAELLRRTA